MIENRLVEKKDTTPMRVISALLPWIQWMNMYVFVKGVSIGYAIIVAIDVFYFVFINKASLKLKIKNKPHKWIIAFMLLYMVLLPIGLLLSQQFNFLSVANRLVKIFFLYSLILIVSHDNLNWKLYKRSLEILVLIACAVIVYQFVSHMLFGSFMDIRFPFLEYYHENMNEKLSGASEADRFRSIFTEPAYFVYFIFQYFPILLFDDFDSQKKSGVKKWLFAGILTVCVILSVSSTGLFLIVFIWIVYIIFVIKRGRTTKKGMLLGIVVIIIASFLVKFYLENETLSFSSYRLTEDYEQSTVVWWRLEAGFENIKEMSFVQQIFGYGMGNFPNEKFMNGIAYTILSVGYIGLFVIVGWIISCFRNSNICGKVTTIIWVLLIITEIMALYSPTMLGYAIIINYSQKKSDTVPLGRVFYG